MSSQYQGHRSARTAIQYAEVLDQLLEAVAREDVVSLSSPLLGLEVPALVALDEKGEPFEVVEPCLLVKHRLGHFETMPAPGPGCSPFLMPVEWGETCFALRHGDGKFIKVGIERPAVVQVTGLDRHGSPLERVLHGQLSVLVQHEWDHLRGVSLLDRVGPLRRKAIKRAMRMQ